VSGAVQDRVVEVEVGREQAELVADELFSLGASAVSERPGPGDSVVLVADVDPAAVRAAGWPCRVVTEDPAWATSWHDEVGARRCGERLVVRPVRVDGAAPDEAAADAAVEVVVDPGTAFGSGSHASTRLCLAALEPLAPGARRVLDVGSGTGVLGVAALLLGPGTLVALDVDPGAVAATRRAVELNGVVDRATVLDGSVSAVAGTFDLVLANLLVPIVEELGPELVARVAPGGAIVVGGLLDHQVDRAVAALSPLALSARRVEADWVALTLVAGAGHPDTTV
jgi:ribosomal protein L11 methyltransferase